MHIRDLLRSSPYNGPKRLEPHGFRSFSQNDEDGILQEIFGRIGTGNRTFVEFGASDGRQNNSRLLLYRKWRGLWIEADPAACRDIERSFAKEISSRHLQLRCSFVTAQNISRLVESAQLGDLDLLSIDVDGNDYWIWQALALRPRLVVIEYNAKFRPPTRWVMAYNPEHRWDQTDYQGASLQSLDDLARQKGYTLVGCCLAGVNAFFVRNDLLQQHFAALEVADLYNPPRYYLERFMASGHPTGTFGLYESLGEVDVASTHDAVRPG